VWMTSPYEVAKGLDWIGLGQYHLQRSIPHFWGEY
jgi:hypothetical protein